MRSNHSGNKQYKIVFWLFGFHPILYLLPRLPVTICRLYRVLRPNNDGVRDREFLAFSRADKRFRLWYKQVSRDQKIYGRLGYAWKNGFGLPMSPLFYNNWLTYRLLYYLGTKYYVLLSVVLYLIGIVFLYIIEGRWWVGILVAFLTLGSPLFIRAQFQLGKPECLWWGFVPLILYALLRENLLLAGVGFSFIAFANFAAAFILCVMIAGFVLCTLPELTSLAMLGIGMSIGIIKTIIRLVPFMRDNWLSSLVTEQADVTKSTRFSITHIYITFFYILILLSMVLIGASIQQILFAAIPLALYWIASLVFYFNDPQILWLLMLSTENAFLVVYFDWAFLGAYLFFIYMSPVILGFRLSQETPKVKYSAFFDKLRRFRKHTLDVLPSYPQLTPMILDILDEIEKCFKAIPDCSRVLMESSSVNRHFGGYRTLIQVFAEVLSQRCIDIQPDEYLRLTNLHFYTTTLTQCNAETPIKEVFSICEAVGASYLLTYSPNFAQNIVAGGGEEVGRISGEFLKLKEWVLQKTPDLILFRLPINTGIIEPNVPFRIEGRILTWKGRAGQTYLIRYNYHRNLQAFQDAQPLKVLPVTPCGSGGIKFIQVTAAVDGKITLKFHPTLF